MAKTPSEGSYYSSYDSVAFSPDPEDATTYKAQSARKRLTDERGSYEPSQSHQSVLGKGDPSKHTGSNFDHSAEEGGKVSNDEYDASKSTQEPLYKTSSRASTRVSGNKPPSQGRASSYGSASKESRSKAGGKARTLTTTKTEEHPNSDASSVIGSLGSTKNKDPYSKSVVSSQADDTRSGSKGSSIRENPQDSEPSIAPNPFRSTAMGDKDSQSFELGSKSTSSNVNSTGSVMSRKSSKKSSSGKSGKLSGSGSTGSSRLLGKSKSGQSSGSGTVERSKGKQKVRYAMPMTDAKDIENTGDDGDHLIAFGKNPLFRKAWHRPYKYPIRKKIATCHEPSVPIWNPYWEGPERDSIKVPRISGFSESRPSDLSGGKRRNISDVGDSKNRFSHTGFSIGGGGAKYSLYEDHSSDYRENPRGSQSNSQNRSQNNMPEGQRASKSLRNRTETNPVNPSGSAVRLSSGSKGRGSGPRGSKSVRFSQNNQRLDSGRGSGTGKGDALGRSSGISNTRNSSPFESGGLRSSQMTSSTAKRSETFYEDEPEEESNIDSDDNVFVEDSEYEDTSNDDDDSGGDDDVDNRFSVPTRASTLSNTQLGGQSRRHSSVRDTGRKSSPSSIARQSNARRTTAKSNRNSASLWSRGNVGSDRRLSSKLDENNTIPRDRRRWTNNSSVTEAAPPCCRMSDCKCSGGNLGTNRGGSTTYRMEPKVTRVFDDSTGMSWYHFSYNKTFVAGDGDFRTDQNLRCDCCQCNELDHQEDLGFIHKSAACICSTATATTSTQVNSDEIGFDSNGRCFCGVREDTDGDYSDATKISATMNSCNCCDCSTQTSESLSGTSEGNCFCSTNPFNRPNNQQPQSKYPTNNPNSFSDPSNSRLNSLCVSRQEPQFREMRSIGTQFECCRQNGCQILCAQRDSVDGRPKSFESNGKRFECCRTNNCQSLCAIGDSVTDRSTNFQSDGNQFECCRINNCRNMCAQRASAADGFRTNGSNQFECCRQNNCQSMCAQRRSTDGKVDTERSTAADFECCRRNYCSGSCAKMGSMDTHGSNGDTSRNTRITFQDTTATPRYPSSPRVNASNSAGHSSPCRCTLTPRSSQICVRSFPSRSGKFGPPCSDATYKRDNAFQNRNESYRSPRSPSNLQSVGNTPRFQDQYNRGFSGNSSDFRQTTQIRRQEPSAILSRQSPRSSAERPIINSANFQRPVLCECKKCCPVKSLYGSKEAEGDQFSGGLKHDQTSQTAQPSEDAITNIPCRCPSSNVVTASSQTMPARSILRTSNDCCRCNCSNLQNSRALSSSTQTPNNLENSQMERTMSSRIAEQENEDTIYGSGRSLSAIAEYNNTAFNRSVDSSVNGGNGLENACLKNMSQSTNMRSGCCHNNATTKQQCRKMSSFTSTGKGQQNSGNQLNNTSPCCPCANYITGTNQTVPGSCCEGAGDINSFIRKFNSPFCKTEHHTDYRRDFPGLVDMMWSRRSSSVPPVGSRGLPSLEMTEIMTLRRMLPIERQGFYRKRHTVL
ncbi:uncharacterized protein LOC142339900 isoform X2 [Convolutriloba macropyga]|uniref:uncharacterized protein LOC142339900 isoform X2 n=1 Tax=Convolutriloba macropyga TaxID=536237 RepID=UPI003F51D0BF